MSCTVNKVLKIAKGQIGYLEKKSNSLLDSFTKNAGSKNYTKYAREYQKFTGSNLQGQAWCDMFVDSSFVTAYGKSNAKKLLGNFSAYTPTSAQYFKDMNRWYTSNPLPGDVIFFENSERICHTGLVVEVSSSRVYTIEGNTSDGEEVIPNGGAVCQKSYLLSNGRIAGYGRPNYDYIKPTKTVSKDSAVNDVMWLQTKLNIVLKAIEGFIPLKVDGDYGGKTQKAVLTYWDALGWNNDGQDDGTKAGIKTIKALNVNRKV
jgi:uncharacterized protein YifN (PemK superfamily)